MQEPTPTYSASRAPTNTQIPTSTASPIPPATPTIATRPITWDELVSFISDDHTNWNKYVPGKYECLDFAIDLVENAGKQNIKAWIVSVMFYDQELGHAFVAFETTDRGIVYIEPQGDNTYIDLRVGQYLCDAWGMYECMGKVKSIETIQCDSDHSGYCSPYTP